MANYFQTQNISPVIHRCERTPVPTDDAKHRIVVNYHLDRNNINTGM